MSPKKRTKNSVIYRSLNLLESKDKYKLLIISFIQVAMSFLDLLGILLLGALSALSVQGVESQHAGNKVSFVLKILHIEKLSFQTQTAILGTVVALILLSKTILSIFFTRRIFYFLAHKGAKISSDLISKILGLSLTDLQKNTSQEILYIVSTGVKNLMVGVLATISNLAADFTLLAVIAFGLFFIDPVIAFCTVSLFGVVGVTLHFLLQVRARAIGVSENRLEIRSNQKILEALSSYRESTVRNRRAFYSKQIQQHRFELGNLNAEMNFQPYVSKYVIETATVLGALGLAGYEFGTKNAVHAVSILVVFMAASSRIAPAALRIQQGLLVIKNSAGSSESTLRMIDKLQDAELREIGTDLILNFSYPDFNPFLKIRALSFKYPGQDSFSVDKIDLDISEGTSVAIVGPSGAGKTTLVDLILGVLTPQSGQVLISGVSPTEASKKWSGGISYVPQNIFILEGSVRENIGQGFPKELATDERVWNALDLAQMKETVLSWPGGLDSQVGEAGAKISGGQRQRLGIARAMFTSPKLLVLDEATSALDGRTELGISQAISKLSGQVTTIIIAHRLSTIRNVDQVVYLEEGQIKAIGKFEEIRRKIPNFDIQAKLMER